ncbi:MAG: hypothetical protein ABFS32_09415, partial [Bacteroidota bacterium]
MLPAFKIRLNAIVILFVLFALQANGQQLVYDLKQEWVNYSSDDNGFLPVNDQNHELNTIGFSLANQGIDQFYLTVYVNKQAYLFYGSKLLTILAKGTTNLKIDSLKNELNDKSPFLTIYGKGLLPGLRTEIRAVRTSYQDDQVASSVYYSGDFSNFFYITATLLIIIFVVLKTRFVELAEQYMLFHRALRIRTIDELIYKIEFLAFPNAFFLILISLTLGFTTISFMYFFPGELSILGIKPAVISLTGLLISWVQLSAIVFILLVIKYLFTRFLSSVFDLKVTNVHYASSLRLILIFAI